MTTLEAAKNTGSASKYPGLVQPYPSAAATDNGIWLVAMTIQRRGGQGTVPWRAKDREHRDDSLYSLRDLGGSRRTHPSMDRLRAPLRERHRTSQRSFMVVAGGDSITGTLASL